MMAGKEGASAGAQEDQEELRRQQTHLKFTASHQARYAARQQTSVRDEDEDSPKDESAARFNESFAANTQDITSALAHLVTQSQQKPQTAAGTGLSGARHAQGSGNNLDGCSDDSSAGAALAAGDGGDVREKLDALVDRVKGLRQRTAEATLFLTVYDLRRAQEEVDKLWASVESTRAELAPRKKFAFRSKSGTSGRRKCKNTNSTSTCISNGAEVEVSRHGVSVAEADQRRINENGDTAPNVGVPGEEQGDGGPGLRDLAEQEVEVLAENADKDKDFNVTDLTKCKVTILHVLGTLRLRRLTSCRVVCGPVRGPIYVEGCQDCVIVAAGRQLRIHDSQDVDFYVRVVSGPIIEDCCGLRFAPAGLRYPEYQHHLEAAGLDKVANAWEDVKDFKWHRAHRSPNWNVIPEDERESDSLVLKAPK